MAQRAERRPRQFFTGFQVTAKIKATRPIIPSISVQIRTSRVTQRRAAASTALRAICAFIIMIGVSGFLSQGARSGNGEQNIETVNAAKV